MIKQTPLKLLICLEQKEEPQEKLNAALFCVLGLGFSCILLMRTICVKEIKHRIYLLLVVGQHGPRKIKDYMGST